MTNTTTTAAKKLDAINAKFFTALDKDAAFTRASAYVILKDGQHAGTVKISAAPSGTVKAYAEDFTGDHIARRVGKATGGGYDKRTAAMSGFTFCGVYIKDDGYDWERQLTDAGLTVIQAL